MIENIAQLSIAAVAILGIALAYLMWLYVIKSSAHAALSERLLLAEQSLELAEKIGGVGSWKVDSTNKALYWSDHVFAIHSRPIAKGPPALETAMAYYHPADRAMIMAIVEAALHNGEGFEQKARIIAEDGVVKNVISRGICQLGDDGAVRYIFGVFIEISPDMPVLAKADESDDLMLAPLWTDS